LPQRVVAGDPVLRGVLAQPAPRRPDLRAARGAQGADRHLRPDHLGLREAGVGHQGALARPGAAGCQTCCGLTGSVIMEAVSEQNSRHRKKQRMTGKERREQLLAIGRELFAERGFAATSVEEIAARAGVSKPVVYEHFGGKEGVYAVVVDREMQCLLGLVSDALVEGSPRQKLEGAALALLRYVEEHSEGFRILARDSHAASGTGSFASLISDIATQVEHVLAEEVRARGYDPKLAPLYAQALV